MLQPGTPVVVASRHAGPGDSFILMHALLNHVHRMPRVVVKATMQWDPAIDVLLNRLPSRSITPTGFAPSTGAQVAAPPSGHVAESAIGELAVGLGPDDAFVIFPEGGNFTPSRRARRNVRLRESGKESLALRAEALQHVLAPQPRGLYAALESAADADVVFIAYSGLDELATVGDLWRALPMEKRITLHAWRVPTFRSSGMSRWSGSATGSRVSMAGSIVGPRRRRRAVRNPRGRRSLAPQPTSLLNDESENRSSVSVWPPPQKDVGEHGPRAALLVTDRRSR